MYVNKSLIIKSIEDAYDTFARLGFEKDIKVEQYNLDTGVKQVDHTILALQLNKDTINIDTKFQFMTEAHPIVYIKQINLPPNPTDANDKLVPSFAQRFYQLENAKKAYSVNSINKIFNFFIVKLKP